MDKKLETSLQSLESILQRQLKGHEQLLALMMRKRDALRDGDLDGVMEFCAQENLHVQSISELEKQRLELVARMTLLVQPGAREPMRLEALAHTLPEPGRARLLALRQTLRQRMAEVKQQTSIARRATESLMRHMQSLVQTVGAMSTGVSTYSRQGSRPKQATAVSTISLTA